MPIDPAVPVPATSHAVTRARHLLSVASEGYWDLDRSAGTIFFSSKVAEQLDPRAVACAEAEADGWRLRLADVERLELVRPGDLERLLHTLDRAAGAGLVELHQEFRLRGPAGEYVWVACRCCIVSVDGEGRAASVCGWLSALGRTGQAEELLRAVIDTVSSLTGKQYFERLAVQLAAALRMRYCLVSELLPGATDRVRSIAYAIDGVITSDVEYDLAGTPCQEVIRKGMCVFPSGVQRLFPSDHALVEMSVECYLGVPLRSASGETMGLLSVLGTQPLPPDGYSAALFEHFAVRASVELDRLRAERQRQATQRQYRQLFEKMPVGFGLFDTLPAEDGGFPRLRWLECNPVMESMLRMPVGEVLGRTLLDVLPHFDRSTYAALQTVLATGEDRQTLHYSTRYQATLELSAFQPAPGQLAVLAQDLTQRLEAASALRESERRFREMMESVNLAAVILDRDGRIQFCNEYLARLLGRDRAGLMGVDWCQEFIPATDRERVSARLQSFLLRTDVVRTGRNEILGRGGQRRLLEWDNTVLLDAHGRPSGIAAIGRDLTDWMAMEEQVRHAQKMEAVGRLAGGVAHDFNNLLTVISGYTRLSLAQVPPGDTNLSRYLNEVVKASDRAAERTRQLLAFGRRQLMQPRPVAVHSLLQGLESVLAEVVGSPIQLVLHLQAAQDVTVADPGQLEQVLLNLAVNARDAMSAGGRLTVSTRNETVDTHEAGAASKLRPGEYVVVCVSDSGRGMSEDVLAHLFEPFFTTKGVGEGTGLGLSTAYGIVGQSGGDIRVTSEVGRGSSFEIYLPCVITDQQGTPVPETSEMASAPSGAASILVAEDQEEVLAFASEVLRGLGYQVAIASHATDALETARRLGWKVDLLLTDLMMPGADGGTLARELQAAIPALKVVFMSGYSDPEDALAPLNETGGHYIRKPFTPEQLASVIRAELGKGVRRVLIADDEDAVRLYIRRVLEEAGYAVREAADGRAAMRELESEPVDVLITDLVMPDQEGIETIRLARKAFPDLRIIAISGAFFGQFLKMAELLGANAVLPKPLTRSAMLDAVRDVLGRPSD
ncbi:response regulator [uncultured Paludibaculum sp.]|uniref:response regulator n=1 Tax=uncultured Paludibaculum sp. TaxID=1765020 RepID=UPI002AAAD92A|nr:response regulator [uncultured Paludibaculum sp.]